MQMTAKIVFLLTTILGIMVLLHGMMVTVIGHSDMFARFIKKVRDPRTKGHFERGQIRSLSLHKTFMHQLIHGYLMELQIAPDVKQAGSSLVVDVSDFLATKVRAPWTRFFYLCNRIHRIVRKALTKS